ncbi:SH3 domain-containing protein [Nodosilinea sp. LEGE 06152]|uniref:SH3 domain-containing protein n=1 Tax=Nodosilinea sp. LEGE 06152 TaxID=2777966 RepID=UPI0018822B78|nr:SH3 domain-containing protein [Nodosilinea sp. LEGE 06152]MBE9157070.1 SH3 domain-containing protein [Nodosilinea sp. LEGE 06152]
MGRPLLALVAISLVSSSCTIRPTGDGGIAVAPMQDTPVNIKALVTQPEAPTPEPSPVPAAAAGQCSPATIAYGEWLAARITGQKEGSRVNVRPQPSTSVHIGSYGLVGESIAVMGEAIRPDCSKWYHVQFPTSGYQGWVFGDFVSIQK